MKKILALLAVLCCATWAFAQTHEGDAVVRWKTIVGNITVSNNDAVGGINPGTTPWSTVGGRARVNLATGQVSFDVDGLVLNRGNADFSGTFNTTPGTCTNPLFLIRIGPDLPGANQAWIATGAVRSFGDSNGHN